MFYANFFPIPVESCVSGAHLKHCIMTLHVHRGLLHAFDFCDFSFFIFFSVSRAQHRRRFSSLVLLLRLCTREGSLNGNCISLEKFFFLRSVGRRIKITFASAKILISFCVFRAK